MHIHKPITTITRETRTGSTTPLGIVPFTKTDLLYSSPLHQSLLLRAGHAGYYSLSCASGGESEDERMNE